VKGFPLDFMGKEGSDMAKFELLFKETTVLCEPVNFEGEILEVSLPGTMNYRVGDVVFLKQEDNKICAPIVKKTSSTLFLLIPLHAQTFLNDRRQFTRYVVNVPGKIKSMNPSSPGLVNITVLDVSFNGFGVLAPQKMEDLTSVYKVFVQEKEFNVEAKVKLINEAQTPEGYRYGATISAIEQDNFDQLRKWILMEQNILTKKSLGSPRLSKGNGVNIPQPGRGYRAATQTKFGTVARAPARVLFSC